MNDGAVPTVTSNIYRYGVHQNLTPAQLFFYVAVEETCEQLGVTDIEAVAAVLAGQNWLPTRTKPMGTTKGTSVASIVSRALLDYDLKRRILPTVTNMSVRKLKVLMVRNLGVFVGRTIPLVGWGILAHDVAVISARSIMHYNRLVKQQDRIF
jgi:hypothetical protein